ncbi:LemA family protein [bacterium]|nr:MAG: LemA family protein [bacterium]RKZ15915.1 MAG: LemA family protein [bacterium]
MSWLPLVLVVALIFAAVTIYNRLVKLRIAAQGAWADVDVQLKRRHNLVANLVETVKGYTTHEADTLEKVVQARNQAAAAGGSGGPAQAGVAESMLTGTLRQLFALSEAYPDLKANTQFQELQHSLGELEAAIQNARRYYNAVVRDYNTRIQSVPDVFVARFGGFTEREFFELTDDDQRAVPKVDFGTGDA